MRRPLLRGRPAKLAILAGLVVGAFTAISPAATLPTTYQDPAWSPDGRHIVFVEAAETAVTLDVVTVDGTLVRKLSPRDRGNVAAPTWSPDGRTIVFGLDHLSAIRVDGTGEHRLPDGGCCAAWGPGGRKIAFSGNPESQAEIYVMNPNGRRRRVVASPDSAHSYWGPTWSPEGQALAFFVDAAPDVSRPPSTWLGVIDKFGGRVRRLKSGLWPDPAWSPDGRKIAAGGIRVLDLSTYRVVQLHAGNHPSWSPDARRLVFEYRHQIYVMDAGGSKLRQLTK